jgi:hypothetical protein
MFRKLLEFFGFNSQPEVDLPCNPCTEGCKSGDDCFKTDETVELIEPAIVEQFYRQDTPPTPTPVEPAANALAPAPVEKKKRAKKVAAPAPTPAPVKKAAKKESKGATTKPATAMTAPKKKTPAKKK